MPYDLDVKDAHFAARIRKSGPDGDELPPIEIDPAPLTIDNAAKLEAARQIANFESAQAEQIAARLEITDPFLAAEIRRALERRARVATVHTSASRGPSRV